ncbi:RidA family protein [Parapusillimonas granuli]|uniref:RidA family protein n=1 Tax=Parapusillimonas granuli TaxID=380911 RepID=A0A853FXJ7_9BURK|nr:RidA family protein [Parapusillimonas granuli]MBB5215878.1 2-iminobutanoate/2-iminopropanoate deaminase [Parapusillimonas granuli]MEB2399431.1 RidA family protein [Alcaligenaceae bacterium]NYT50824.1 RidA family protein [Parapusillimonas granuli]
MDKLLVGMGDSPSLPYAPATVWQDLVFVSGQVGFRPGTRDFAPDIGEQTRQALRNVCALLAEAGSGPGKVLKMTIYMTDMTGEFGAMNEVFREFFPHDPPSRTTVGISHLGKPGLKIEIDALAVRAS